MEPLMIRNIIWDVDGTLFDTYPAIAGAFHKALHDLGHDAALSWIEELARESLGMCASTLAEVAQTNADTLADMFDTYYATVSAADQPTFPGVRAVCEEVCARGGKNVIVTHRGRAATLELLAAGGLTGFFSGVVTRDDAYPRKPDPAAFNAIIEQCELSREETITVGDRDIDIEAGRAARVFTCLYGPGNGGARPGLSIRHYSELLDYLRAHAYWPG
jgi:phosphoglycolate phosphatase-like HAD superfamily hydrolase